MTTSLNLNIEFVRATFPHARSMSANKNDVFVYNGEDIIGHGRTIIEAWSNAAQIIRNKTIVSKSSERMDEDSLDGFAAFGML